MKPKRAQADRDDDAVDGGGENAPRQGCTLQGDIDARTFLHFRPLGRLDRDSAQSRRRRDYFRGFQNAGTVTIEDRLGQFVERGLGRSPGTRELDDLCCGCGWGCGCAWGCDWRCGRGDGRARGLRQLPRSRRWTFGGMSDAVGKPIQGQRLVGSRRCSARKSRGIDRNATCERGRDPRSRNAAAATDSGAGGACAGLDND